MIVNKSEQEKRKLILDNLDKCMMVEAGAGAGKTSLVVKRNIEQIKRGVLKADELVDITFTNAAAEELRTRLLDALHKAEEDKTLTDEERNRIKDARRDESLIQISTIHSFCKRLLNEQSFAAKLPLDVRLLDDAEATARKTRFFNDWYRRQDTSVMNHIEEEFYRGEASKFIYSTFLDICELPDDTNFIYDETLIGKSAKTTEEYVEAIRDAFDDMFKVLVRIAADELPDKDFTTFEKTSLILYGCYKNAYEQINSDTDIDTMIELYDNCRKQWVKEGKEAYKANQKDLKISGAMLEGANGKFSAYIGNQNLTADLKAYQAVLIIGQAMNARREYREYCKSSTNRHEITNDMLLQEALRLVEENEEARKYFQNKFSCIYVDEFQDTDLVQRDLVRILCQDPEDDTKLKPGSFFFVGDPKQSIYAFRGADIDVYEDTKKRYEDDSVTEVEEYVLDDNYRSEKPIVDWVNCNFESKFVDYSPMNAPNNNKDEKGVLRGVYKVNYPVWIKEESKALYEDAEDGREKDSLMVASIVSHLVEEKIKIWDKDINDEWVSRDITYKDFLILTPGKKAINRYASKLKQLGIPINLYGAIENVNEDIIIRFATLYKSFATYDSKAKHGAYEVLMGERIDTSNLAEAMRRYDLIRVKVDGMTKENKVCMSGMDLLHYFAHHLEYILTDKPTGEEVVRAQSRIQQMIEYIETQSIGSRQDIYRAIDDYINADNDRELSLERDADAVQFMNLHKAKGLEGKILIICARGKKKNSSSESYRTLNDYYPSAHKTSGNFSSYVPSYINAEGIDGSVRDKYNNEMVRKDYVEATRGAEAVIFMDALTGNCYFDKYDFSEAKELLEISKSLKKDIEDIGNDKYGIKSSTATAEEYNLNAWDANLDATQGYHMERSVTPSGLESSDNLDTEKSGDRPYGGVFGTVMHRCFELLVNKIKNGESYNVDAIICQSIMESYTEVVMDEADKSGRNSDEAVKFYQDYLKEKLNEFIANKSLIDEITSAKEVYTEMSFSQYAEQKDMGAVSSKLNDRLHSKKFKLDDDEPYWVNGIADLVIVKPSGDVHIIDYKTDHKGDKSVKELEAHLHKAYDNQQEMYRYVMSMILGVPVDEVEYSYYHMYM